MEFHGCCGRGMWNADCGLRILECGWTAGWDVLLGVAEFLFFYFLTPISISSSCRKQRCFVFKEHI